MPRLTRHYANWPAGVPHTLEISAANLFTHLQETAGRLPGKPAVVFYGRSTSFGELHRSALALAGCMQQRLGVRRGDRVLLMTQNCPQFFVAFYAVMRCDAVVVALSPMSTREEMAYYAADSGARVLIATQDMAERAEALLAAGELDACVIGAPGEMAGNPQEVPWLENTTTRTRRLSMPAP